MPVRPPSAHEILSRAQVPAMLISNVINIRYLTGVSISLGRLLVTKKSMTLFVDGRYEEKVKSMAQGQIRVRPYEEWYAQVASLGSRCGFEAEHVSVARLEQWKKACKNKNFAQKIGEKNHMNTKFVRTINVIEFYRRRKSNNEIKLIRKACTITRSILKYIPKMLHRGVTEKDMAWHIALLARERGADGLAFEPIVAFGEHTARPHHEPTDRRLKPNDIVQIDIGARYRGYASDYSRVYFTGPKTAEQEKCYRALVKAKKSAEQLVRPGVSNHTLDAAARKALKEANIEEFFTHSLGHGVGLEIHEGITLSQRAPKTVLIKHEVITIEPGVYFPRKWGMRLEDTVIVR